MKVWSWLCRKFSYQFWTLINTLNLFWLIHTQTKFAGYFKQYCFGFIPHTVTLLCVDRNKQMTDILLAGRHICEVWSKFCFSFLLRVFMLRQTPAPHLTHKHDSYQSSQQLHEGKVIKHICVRIALNWIIFPAQYWMTVKNVKVEHFCLSCVMFCSTLSCVSCLFWLLISFVWTSLVFFS